jgi:hypothetical protein
MNGELPPFGHMWLWGLIGTVAMTAILQASQGLGFSRLSLPFLMGTFVSANRDRAVVLGFILYVIGGWLFAFLYFYLFATVRLGTWWFGAVAGFVHGLFLLVCALPLLPYLHPRMASEYHGAAAAPRRLEPPGFLALNYGYMTPTTTLLAQTVYGAVLGGFVQLSRGGF